MVYDESINMLLLFRRELGIGIVPYSPLGRGFFGGKAVVETLPKTVFWYDKKLMTNVESLYYCPWFRFVFSLHLAQTYLDNGC